ncbi:MAG: TetR/AcrR family transcriptional regulator [Actinobacteria bacterium]|nr:TetR/AcrR family transcriptional regulator [Actinomycetota bacterium]
MPRVWHAKIEAHRRAVRDATLDSTAALVGEHGLRSVTMSQIAAETGIGRATLYKYFPDVDAILVAWHERQVSGHLEHLGELRDQAGGAGERLEAVLEAYALIHHDVAIVHGGELVALLHRGGHVGRAQHLLRDFIRDLLTEGAETGDLRNDVSSDELAGYCLHALSAASGLSSKAAVRRLVTVTRRVAARPLTSRPLDASPLAPLAVELFDLGLEVLADGTAAELERGGDLALLHREVAWEQHEPLHLLEA